MSEPLDVSLRVRMRYEAGGAAAKAIDDVAKVRATAERLGAGAGGDRLAQGLRGASGQAQGLDRDLLRLATTATRLGAGDGVGRLAGGLKEAGQAAGGAARELTLAGQAAARFGAVSTVGILARDLKAVHAPAQAVRRDLADVREAADKAGRGPGLRDLDADLQRATRRADELERRLGAVGRRTGSHGGGSRAEFGDELLRASGLGVGGLRFGMSSAAAGGLAAGAGLAAVGGGMALATKQAISFQHAMTEVGKAVGETPAGLRDLETRFLDLSRRSGIRSTEIAGIAAQGGYFNIPREQIPGFTDISTKAAVGFQMRPDEAAEALGPLMKAYKLKDNDALRLAGDAVNTVGDSVGVRERNILNYLNRTSGISGMERIPIAQNAAIGGAIQSLGVAPDVAATGVGQVFSRLSNANLEGKEFQRGLRGLHMSGRQVKAMMDQDAVGGLLTVLERINQLSDTKKPNVIRDMFGEGEIAAVSRMAESVGTIREALDKVSDPAKYRGSLEKTFKIFSSDTTAAINRAGTALESFATRLGQRFDPAVKASADLMARWLGGMTKAIELADRAKILSDKQIKGEGLTDKEQAEVAANPKLKAETDRRVGIGREDAARRAIVEEDGRARARTAPPGAPAPAGPPAPRAPDEQDAAAAEARERARLRLQGQIRDLDAEIATRRGGGYETTADRLRLRKLQQQYERQFPEGDGTGKGDALPGTGKRSDLQEGVKASLASYHEEVEQTLTRTERFVREIGKRMTEELSIKPKVQDAAFRFGGGDGVRIERASLGGGGWGGSGGGGLGGGSPGGGLGGRSGGFRGMPGRFGGAVPMPRGGAGRFGGGRAAGAGMPDPGANPGAYKAVLDHIAQAEGTAGQPGGGYDTSLAYGKLLPGGAEQNLTGKTLDQIDALQTQMLRNPANRWNSSAIGRYQIVRSTLRRLRKQLGLRGDELYDAKMQDRLGAELARARGADAGGLGKEWTSLHGERGRRAAELMQEIPRDASTAPSGTRPDAGARAGAGQAGANGQFDPLGGAARRYTSGFGMRDHPIHGGRRMHHGQDLAAPAGTPVNAMQGGRVTAISRMGDVTITHPDGSTKTYRHIDPSGIAIGQAVEGGAPIGRLRAHDPRATGPHLHLEATDAQGRKYDPRAEIEAAGRDGAGRAGDVAGGDPADARWQDMAEPPPREMGEPPDRDMAERPGRDMAEDPRAVPAPRQLTPWTRRPAEPGPRPRPGPEVLADPGDERRRVDEGPTQLRPWTPQAAHPSEDRPVAKEPTAFGRWQARREKVSIDDTIEAYERTPEGQADKKRDAEMFNRRGRMYAEGEIMHRNDRAPDADFSFSETRDFQDDLYADANERRGGGKSYAERLDSGDRLKQRWRGEHGEKSEFEPDRELTLDQIRKFRAPDPEPRSPRFMDPASYQLKPGAGGDQNSGAPGGARFGLGGPSVVQHFHGGFDAHEVGRRAQLEQNREVRRTMAGALHDVGHPVSV